LTKAVETCFPQATTLLCCRHLDENVQQRLQDKVRVPAEVGQDIVRRVFGAEGLAGGRFRTLSERLRTLFSMTGEFCYPNESTSTSGAIQHCFSFDIPSDLWEKRARTSEYKFSEFCQYIP